MKTLKNVLVLAALLLLSVNAAQAGSISAIAEASVLPGPPVEYDSHDDYAADAMPGWVYYYFNVYDGGCADVEWSDVNGYDSRNSGYDRSWGGNLAHGGGELWCQATAYLTDTSGEIGYAYASIQMTW